VKFVIEKIHHLHFATEFAEITEKLQKEIDETNKYKVKKEFMSNPFIYVNLCFVLWFNTKL